MGENMPNIAAVSQDRLCAKGDAVNAVTPDDSVVSAINKMGSLNMSDSNGAGCNKSDKLPKDRFTKVKIIQYLTSVQCSLNRVRTCNMQKNTVKPLSIVFQGGGKQKRYIRENDSTGKH
jgi:hypothetical protein